MGERLARSNSLDTYFNKGTVRVFKDSLLLDENGQTAPLQVSFKRLKQRLVPALVNFRGLNVYLASSMPPIVMGELGRDSEEFNYFIAGFGTVLSLFFDNDEEFRNHRTRSSVLMEDNDEVIKSLRKVISSKRQVKIPNRHLNELVNFVGTEILARKDYLLAFRKGAHIAYKSLEVLTT